MKILTQALQKQLLNLSMISTMLCPSCAQVYGQKMKERLLSGLLALLPATVDGKAMYQGRPYVWAQIVAGLRERVVAAAPPVLMPGGVTASEVIIRVMFRLKG